MWICPRPHGHIQATGTDAAGRQQYRYHDVWREEQDQAKFDRVGKLAERLPEFRKRVQADLDEKGLTRDRVLAAAARMLDIGLFRVGGEAATSPSASRPLRMEHVTCAKGRVSCSYPAKGGKPRRGRRSPTPTSARSSPNSARPPTTANSCAARTTASGST